LLNRYNYGKRHQTIAKVWWPSSGQRKVNETNVLRKFIKKKHNTVLF